MTVAVANETTHPDPDPARLTHRHTRETARRTAPRPHTDEPDELALQARGELLVLAPAGTTTPDGRVYQVLVQRGVRVRVVQELPTRGCVHGAAPGDVDLRRLPTVPHTLILVDRRTALLTTGGVTTTVNQPAMVEALFLLFVSLWQRARPEEEAAPARRHRDVAVLNLLATGATDEVAATRLGVSIRTYRRWVADLMARLGATSRFQAGVLAARDGWCTDPVVATARPDPITAGVYNADRPAVGQQVRGAWTSSETVARSCHRVDVDLMARPA
ncbi:helix-turn-helix transcriptional regulator [Pseudonocardia saturnea]